jgi:hypothetical protein
LNIRIVISSIKDRDIIKIGGCTYASLATRFHQRYFANITRAICKILARHGNLCSKISGTYVICSWIKHIIREIDIEIASLVMSAPGIRPILTKVALPTKG